jgi:hypothetical protein
MKGRRHPNARIITGKVPQALEIGHTFTEAVRGRSPQKLFVNAAENFIYSGAGTATGC